MHKTHPVSVSFKRLKNFCLYFTRRVYWFWDTSGLKWSKNFFLFHLILHQTWWLTLFSDWNGEAVSLRRSLCPSCLWQWKGQVSPRCRRNWKWSKADDSKLKAVTVFCFTFLSIRKWGCPAALRVQKPLSEGSWLISTASRLCFWVENQMKFI